MSDIDELGYQEEQVINLNWALKLERIKGIGNETAHDIWITYDSEALLIEALKNNKTTLRNDVVKKLKVYYELEGGINGKIFIGSE